jgi:excisionase family DNA binding protein
MCPIHSEPLALTHSGELVRRKKLFVEKGNSRSSSEGVLMLEREEELLNSKQVAVILDLSPDTVNEFARKNILPAFKKGKQWRFRKRDISIFYKKQSRDIRDA